MISSYYYVKYKCISHGEISEYSLTFLKCEIKVEDWNIENQIGIVLGAHKPGPIWMLCYAIVEIQWPLVIIFINVLYSLTTIGTGNLNCNKWHTELDQCEKCIFLFENKIFLCHVWCWVMWWLCLSYLLDIQLNGWNKNVLTFRRGLTEVRRIRLNIGLWSTIASD